MVTIQHPLTIISLHSYQHQPFSIHFPIPFPPSKPAWIPTSGARDLPVLLVRGLQLSAGLRRDAAAGGVATGFLWWLMVFLMYSEIGRWSQMEIQAKRKDPQPFREIPKFPHKKTLALAYMV